MLATPLGEAFVRRATAILNDVRRARDEFEQLRGNAVGSITVGLSIAAHLWLLPKVAKAISAAVSESPPSYYRGVLSNPADAGDAQSVGAHIIDVSCPFRPSCNGPRTMDNAAICQSRPDRGPGERGAVRAADHCGDESRRPTFAGSGFSS